MKPTCDNYSPWSQEPDSICLIGECIWFIDGECADVDSFYYGQECPYEDGTKPDENTNSL